MAPTSRIILPQVLATLAELKDDELREVIAHAQGLLLDRPVPPDLLPALAVEVVGREESRLLAAYRALAPLAQRRLLGHVVRLVRAPRRLARRHKPAVAAATLMRPRTALAVDAFARQQPSLSFSTAVKGSLLTADR